MRTIPVNLLSHKQQDATTLCMLIKIRTQDGSETVGMTTLDRDITYDDGDGDLTYSAPVGFQPSSIYSAADFGVDNAEFQSLVPEYDLPLNEEKVNAGLYDYADFWLYEINYEDLTQGHWVVMHGKLGQMRSVDGISLFGEMRSLMDQMRKPLCELDSLSCRAKFGSQPGEERFPCGFDASVLWVPGTVTSVGLEVNRTFTDTGRTEPDGYFEPGLMQWLTGSNAGQYLEIESNTSSGLINLNFPTNYPIQAGDTYRIRRDCNKRARDAEKGCKHFWGADWIHHFRGEPDIPVGEAGTITTPGAAVGPGSGGKTGNPMLDAALGDGE